MNDVIFWFIHILGAILAFFGVVYFLILYSVDENDPYDFPIKDHHK